MVRAAPPLTTARRRPSPLVVLVAVAASACSSFTESPGAPGGDAASSGGDFEAATTACGPGWTSESGALSSGTPHGGARSCRVCENGQAPAAMTNVYLRSTTPTTVPSGQRLVQVRAFVRIATAGAAGVVVFHLGLRDAAGRDLAPVDVDRGAVNGDYREVTYSFRAPDEAATIAFAVQVQLPRTACYEVDDVSVGFAP